MIQREGERQKTNDLGKRSFQRRSCYSRTEEEITHNTITKRAREERTHRFNYTYHKMADR